MFNPKRVKNDFPIFSRVINNHELVYLDNAATTQKPQSVIDAIADYYAYHNANVHRGVHTLSEEATNTYDAAHENTASFVRAKNAKNIVFTKNATESLNLVAYAYARNTLKKGARILTTIMEHHSNIVPWQQVPHASVDYAPITNQGTLDLEAFSELLSKKPHIVALTHASNVLGTINPIRELVKMSHDAGAVVVVDGAQGAPQVSLDMQKIGADAYAFSAHKMLGPMGMGVLYATPVLLDSMPPFLFGGDMISSVTTKKSEWNELPWKFEAGTPNVAGAAGLSAALAYLSKLGMGNVEKHEKKLASYAIKVLETHERVTTFGPKNIRERGGVVSFSVANAHAHDVASLLNDWGVAIRSGNHCAEPLISALGKGALARASMYVYNTKEDVDMLFSALKNVFEVFV
ncbi:cysteine desulfurase [archaeon CG10_big_fil_rev_8_21_14_0_10_43_11]|nr:MAG: cysteine desulfurase [archaeon CG10_big_fil_rev_8_21_14_0_10_43_11]